MTTELMSLIKATKYVCNKYFGSLSWREVIGFLWIKYNNKRPNKDYLVRFVRLRIIDYLRSDCIKELYTLSKNIIRDNRVLQRKEMLIKDTWKQTTTVSDLVDSTEFNPLNYVFNTDNKPCIRLGSVEARCKCCGTKYAPMGVCGYCRATVSRVRTSRKS